MFVTTYIKKMILHLQNYFYHLREIAFKLKIETKTPLPLCLHTTPEEAGTIA